MFVRKRLMPDGAKPKKSIARLLATTLRGAWRCSPGPLDIGQQDLDRVTGPLLVSGSAGLVWWRARLSNLKHSPAAEPLKQAFRFQTLQSDLQQQEIASLFVSFRERGIEPILVKGWAVAQSYAETGLRPSGDIDLLVRPAEMAAAAEVLRVDSPRQFNVDLAHREFAKLGRDSLEAVWNRSRLVQQDIRVLAPEDHLAFLCLHMLRHGAWRPLWLCDVAAALESRHSGFDWKLCLGGSRQRSGWIQSAIFLAHHLVGASLIDTPLATGSIGLPRWLVREVLRQWETPNPVERMPLDYRAPLAKTLARPASLTSEIRARWPNPIEATIRVGGPLNDLPRLPFQIGDGLIRLARLMRRPATGGLAGEP
jgi:hypothetical protein